MLLLENQKCGWGTIQNLSGGAFKSLRQVRKLKVSIIQKGNLEGCIVQVHLITTANLQISILSHLVKSKSLYQLCVAKINMFTIETGKYS